MEIIIDTEIVHLKRDVRMQGKQSVLKKVKELFPTSREIRQYSAVIICGLSLWGASWFLCKDIVLPGGYIFQMAIVIISGYVAGHILERFTTLPPLVGMTLVGALYRNLSQENFLNHPVANLLDYHLRRVYPVIILTKGPLGWDWEHIRHNTLKVFTLATIPWTVECIFVAIFAHVLLSLSWPWGLHLGSILASVSPAVIVPTAVALNSRGLGTKSEISKLVANAGGLDTAVTEGVFGVINSILFFPATLTYKITKAALAIIVGILLGILWGIIADWVPEHTDKYAGPIRSLHLFLGGWLLTYACGYMGWGGTAGVAIMVCAGTAATRWARRGWLLNSNPVSEVYSVLWRICEPMLFTLSGYYLETSQMKLYEFWLIIGCIVSALSLRLLAAFIVVFVNGFTLKESFFIVVTWIPKAIVEAVLVRVAADSLWTYDSPTDEDRRAVLLHSNIIVIAVMITSTLGSALTTLLGPVLLSQDSRIVPEVS